MSGWPTSTASVRAAIASLSILLVSKVYPMRSHTVAAEGGAAGVVLDEDSLWHAAHRIFHTLHDLGLRANGVAWTACYGGAMAGTVAAALALLAVG